MVSGTQPPQNMEIPSFPGHRRFVTLRGERGREEVDLEMPGDQPIQALLPDLLKALSWPDAEAGRPLHYQLRTESGKILGESETLAEAGVENSDVLWIALAEPGGSSESDLVAEGFAPARDNGEGPATGFAPVAATNPSPKDRRGSLAPPRMVHLDVREPSLVSPKGWIFVLGQPPIRIGRASHAGRPEVDLTKLDPDLVSSRLHAEILLEDGQYLLKPEPTTNGTFVNGVEVKPFEKHALKNGEVIQFGYEGVALTFVDGTADSLPASFFRG